MPDTFLPLAISDAGIAGSAAILGGLIGAVVGGLVDWALQARRERSRAKAGARLVAMDLSRAASVLASVQGDSTWYPFQRLMLPAWPRYSDVLGERLSSEQFEQVSEAVGGMEYLDEGMRLVFEANGNQAVVGVEDRTIRKVGEVRGSATLAYNSLAATAGHDPIEGQLGEAHEES